MQIALYSHTNDANNAAENDNNDMDNDDTIKDKDPLESQSLLTRPTSLCIIKLVHSPTVVFFKSSISKVSSAKILPATVFAFKKTITDITKKKSQNSNRSRL